MGALATGAGVARADSDTDPANSGTSATDPPTSVSSSSDSGAPETASPNIGLTTTGAGSSSGPQSSVTDTSKPSPDSPDSDLDLDSLGSDLSDEAGSTDSPDSGTTTFDGSQTALPSASTTPDGADVATIPEAASDDSSSSSTTEEPASGTIQTDPTDPAVVETTGGTEGLAPGEPTAGETEPPGETAAGQPEITQTLAGPSADPPAVETVGSSGDVGLESLSAEDAAIVEQLAAAVARTVETDTTATGSLPTPQQVIAQIQDQIDSTINTVKAQLSARVTDCLCEAVNQVQVFVKNVGDILGQLTSPSGDTPGPENPVMWTVLAWVRKQVDDAVAAFNRSPLGSWLQEAEAQITKLVDSLGYSPLGRMLVANYAAFLEQCGDSTELPSDLDRTTLVSGLNEPTDFELLTDPDDPDHVHTILITEKSGSIKSYDVHTGELTTLIELDVVSADGERGLASLAVDPNFWNAGQEGYHTVYAGYTNADNYDQLSSFTMSDSLDSLGNEQVLVTSTLPAQELHHGGELEFDPEGKYLYWAVGDNTTNTNSQDLSNIHGKILRLNRDGTPVDDNPFIESDNPNTRLIYAYGFRNPFRFDFAPDGTLLAGDVGEKTWEELNVISPEANYGWPYAEGICDDCGYTNPLYAYHHPPETRSGSITSVLVYTGDALGEQYTDKVFIADYSLGWIRVLTVDSQYSSVIDVQTFDGSAGTVVKLAEGPDGNIYQLDIYPGAISVIAPSGGNRAPTAVITASATSTAEDSLTVDFSGADSTDPDAGDTLTYLWDFGNGTTSTEANPTATFTRNAGDDFTAYTVTLTVSDGEKDSQATQRIVVGSTPPTATISVSDLTYDAGDTIVFSASATDDQDGELPEAAYSWTVEFHHLDHKHPFLNDVTGSTGTMTVPTNPDQLDTTYYRIILVVTDSSGLSTTQYVDVNPNLVELTFGASDPDATYTLDGIPHQGTYTERGVVGVVRTLGAVSPQTVGGEVLVFDSWSDGGAATHTVVTPSTETSYTVTYTPESA
ncbi:PQQ-dependent sugar dehydrogenase [Mycolicibacterium xanthum]|uniref:PQQ-dependent sugar dehydrogenase n=1 Tax=Mycolicibacterium xanthum TaxID=2796469 RepID=UPI00272B5763|nr:PQQ-dependent sugar dehydrogenase [Mycolicibacterium xanthum]